MSIKLNLRSKVRAFNIYPFPPKKRKLNPNVFDEHLISNRTPLACFRWTDAQNSPPHDGVGPQGGSLQCRILSMTIAKEMYRLKLDKRTLFDPKEIVNWDGSTAQAAIINLGYEVERIQRTPPLNLDDYLYIHHHNEAGLSTSAPASTEDDTTLPASITLDTSLDIEQELKDYPISVTGTDEVGSINPCVKPLTCGPNKEEIYFKWQSNSDLWNYHVGKNFYSIDVFKEGKTIFEYDYLWVTIMPNQVVCYVAMMYNEVVSMPKGVFATRDSKYLDGPDIFVARPKSITKQTTTP